MSLLVFAEFSDNALHPYSSQVLRVAQEIAKLQPQDIYTCGYQWKEAYQEELARLGVKKHFHLSSPCAYAFGTAMLGACKAFVRLSQAKTLLFAHNDLGKMMAPQLAVAVEATYTPACVEVRLADEQHLLVRRGIFSGKAEQTFLLKGDMHILSIQPNAVEAALPVSPSSIEVVAVQLPEDIAPDVEVLSIEESDKKSPSLTEADIVVSGGMGMQSAENWHLIEALAEKLGAAKACTRLVSDAHWRPHEEHVGQTGITITPQLYIAIGISGAIQHVAGINQSKIIVAINKDPDAPIFSVADYGIVGDALDILPRLISTPL